MNSLRFKIILGSDNKYRFTLLLANAVVVTDSKTYNSIIETLDGIKSFKFVLDDTFEVLDTLDGIQKYEQGLQHNS